jgi:hypothetical protein
MAELGRLSSTREIMKFNYFISYDLNSPGQDYSKLTGMIGALGAAYRCQRSMFYLRSSYTQQQIGDALWAAMDSNDSLIVVLATDARMYNLLPGAAEFIQKNWNS